jgi:biopolymer transport protein ExbD
VDLHTLKSRRPGASSGTSGWEPKRSEWSPNRLRQHATENIGESRGRRARAAAAMTHRPMLRIKELPNFGMIYGFILGVVMFIFMILMPLPPQGLMVDFREQNILGVEKSPWAETTSVYVDARKGFLVNGQPVKREESGAKLREKLEKQMVWTVYLEADNDCPYMDAVYAIDMIQGLGAKLIWITPRTRAEWKRKQAP